MGPWREHVRRRARIVLGVQPDLREGDVVGGIDEFSECAIVDRREVHPEITDRSAMDWHFVWIVSIGAHRKVPPGTNTMSVIFFSCAASRA